MSEVLTVSPKYQIVIPKRIRDAMDIHPGQKVRAIRYGDRIELIPVIPLNKMRGFLKGIETDVRREDDRL
ncbi:MAG: AbrB/MazE/SpoVT family DNA-binding domain-containing protein [Chromatiaceae bacterium]|jgi:AbrB family looped-hinge helix DNA binding protein|nr:AbrB/MazE/SpoVT family DNA-binding domain-containing protein [Chromatiaceae bacterium]